jgi:hypothetical protein
MARVDQWPSRRLAGQRQTVDRGEGLGDSRQVFGQARGAADDLFDQQAATRQRRAHRQRAFDARHMAAGGGALVARSLVGEVGHGVEAHLALLGAARQQAGADEAHMVVRQALVLQRLQRSVGQRWARIVQRSAQLVGDGDGDGHGR